MNTPQPQTTPEPGKITTRVLDQINGMMTRGRIAIPADYSVENALNSAWLALQEVQNIEKKNIFVSGVLQTNLVTQDSLVNALHDMVIQGLNPAKKQCYFIVYGTKLAMQRSYHGDIVVAKRVKPGLDVYFDVIHEGETIELQKIRGKSGFVTMVARHDIKFPRSGAIAGAFCGAVDTATGECVGDDIMDIERIKKSWGMSKTYGKFPNGIHDKFEAEMAIRTVVRHWCKPIFNSSNDQALLESIKRQEMESAEFQMDAEVAALSNGEIIDVTPILEANSSTSTENPVAAPCEATCETPVEPGMNRAPASPETKPEEAPY